MNIIVNNKSLSIDDAITVLDLLYKENFQANKIAVAVNSEFIARHHYANSVLSDGDIVDILSPVQGG